MASDRRHGARRSTWRGQSVFHLVPNGADDTGEDRQFRNDRRKSRAYGLCRRLRGSLDQRADATPQRLTDAVKPGDKFQIAIFGINGPISVAPENFVWFRAAKVEFFR